MLRVGDRYTLKGDDEFRVILIDWRRNITTMNDDSEIEVVTDGLVFIFPDSERARSVYFVLDEKGLASVGLDNFLNSFRLV